VTSNDHRGTCLRGKNEEEEGKAGWKFSLRNLVGQKGTWRIIEMSPLLLQMATSQTCTFAVADRSV